MSEPAPILLPPAGIYPERDEGAGESVLNQRGRAFWLYCERRWRAARRHKLAGRYRAEQAACEALDLAGLGEAARDFRRRIRSAGVGAATAARAFALVGRAMRLLGTGAVDDTDLAAAWVMLNGAVAETPPAAEPQRAVVLAACTAALAGQPVHLIGPDDAWAAAAAAFLAPIAAALGIGCAALRKDDPPAERLAACGRSIVVAAARELAFEYLRDRLRIGDEHGSLRLLLRRLDSRSGGPSLRGLAFGIVAEADAVLLDGANAPIAIAGNAVHAPAEAIAVALKLAAALAEGSDFVCDRGADEIRFTERGRQRLAEFTADLPGVWRGAAARERLVQLALRACLLYTAGRHYRVDAGRLLALDPDSGDVRPEGSLPAALQQMIEAKEGLPLSRQGGTLARLAMQRFFRRYVHLGGISATAREAAPELARIYRLPVLRTDSGQPAAPRLRVLASAAEKWAAVAGRVAALRDGPWPVLVGVGSPADADALGAVLDGAGIAWRRAEDAADPAPIAAAGAVVVALPAAWRPAWGEAAGGFHVILADGQPGARLDRQLARRAGQAACCEAIVALEDPVARGQLASLPAALRALLRGGSGGMRRWFYRLAQRRAADEPMRLRRRLLQYDMQQGNTLAFAGRGE